MGQHKDDPCPLLRPEDTHAPLVNKSAEYWMSALSCAIFDLLEPLIVILCAVGQRDLETVLAAAMRHHADLAIHSLGDCLDTVLVGLNPPGLPGIRLIGHFQVIGFSRRQPTHFAGAGIRSERHEPGIHPHFDGVQQQACQSSLVLSRSSPVNCFTLG